MWRYFCGVLGDLKTVLGEWACKEFLPGKAWASFFLPFPLVSWSAIDCILSPICSTPTFPVPHSWVTFQVPDRLQRRHWRRNVEGSKSSCAFENPFFLPETTRTFFLPATIKSQEWVCLVYCSISKAVSPLEMEAEVSLKRWYLLKDGEEALGQWKESSLVYFQMHLSCICICGRHVTDTSHLRCSSISGNQLLARSNLWASE